MEREDEGVGQVAYRREAGGEEGVQSGYRGVFTLVENTCLCWVIREIRANEMK